MIYCWYKENGNNINDCDHIKLKQKQTKDADNKVKKAGTSTHKWSIKMRWIDRLKLMEIFAPCNKRLNDIIYQMPDLVLGIGEWIDYNQLYQFEKNQNHTDHPIV